MPQRVSSLGSLVAVTCIAAMAVSASQIQPSIFISAAVPDHVALTVWDPAATCDTGLECLLAGSTRAQFRASGYSSLLAGGVRAKCNVPSALLAVPGPVNISLACDSIVAGSSAPLMVGTKIELRSLSRQGTCISGTCSVLITLASDLPSDTLSAAIKQWSVSCASSRTSWYPLSSGPAPRTAADAAAGLSVSVVEFAADLRSNLDPSCTLALAAAMMSPLPLGPVDFTAMATQEARSVSLAARLDLKLGGLASKKQTPLLYQLTSLVARRMAIACNCSDLPLPSPMPSRSPVPPTLSPSPSPVPAPPTTSGTAIASGNLANCRVGLDMSFTSRLGLSGWTESMDDVATVRTGASGAFQVPGVDGYLRVLPDSDAASWTSTSVTAAQTASGGSSPCYDSLTNKRLTLHLSAPGSYSVVSVTSTLVATLHAAHPAYSGASVQRVETDVKAALRLDLDLNLATANTYSQFTVQKDER
ncbi:hypothetical protein V8C86DRAFT_261852 [Haematococcus lacustris]